MAVEPSPITIHLTTQKRITPEAHPESSAPPCPAPPPLSVWILTNAPSPYQVELFNAAADRSDLHPEVRFLRDSSSPGPVRRFAHSFHRSWLSLTRGDELRFHGRLIWQAAFGQHDVYILSGLYTSVTFLCCAGLLHCRNKPWAIWWERPHAKANTPTTGIKGWLHRRKDDVRRWLLSRAKCVIGIGTIATEAYEAEGVPRDRLFVLPYCCDVTRFETPASMTRTPKRPSEPLRFLYSGQLIPRKGGDVLLTAFTTVAARHPHVTLTLLGDGVDRPALEASVPLALKSRVNFVGLVPQNELPQKFAEADVFVFPSRHDGWAVVINEACAARLPIIATRQTGAARDLVHDGENGFVVEANDVAALEHSMNWMIEHPESLIPFGHRSRELVEPFSAENGAKLMAQIVKSIATPLSAISPKSPGAAQQAE